MGARAAVRRPPVITLALIVAIIVTFIRLQQGLHLPTNRFIDGAFSVHAITGGDYKVLLTSTLLTLNLFMVASICISLLVTMGSYEVLAGHTRAAALAVFAAVVGPLSIAAGLGLLSVFGSTWAVGRMDTLDIGASAIVAASSGAIAGVVRDKRLTVGLILFLISGLLVHHQLADCEHMLIFPWGYLGGRVFGRGRTHRGRTHRVRHPRRSLTFYGVAAVLITGCAVAGAASALPPNANFHSSTGVALSPPQTIQTTYPSPAMHGPRGVVVMLPAGYNPASHRRYPVVVLLHGDPGSPLTFIQLGALNAAQNERGVAPFIGVLPNGNGPALQRSWFVNLPSQHIGTSVAIDLRRWVTSTYRTNGDYNYAGLSSGGFAAAYMPLLDPRAIHAVCALSGFYDGNIVPLRGTSAAAHKQASAIAHIRREPAFTFLSDGTTDHRTGPQTRRYAAALKAVGKHYELKTYPGGHGWVVWRPAFKQCLRVIVPATTTR